MFKRAEKFSVEYLMSNTYPNLYVINFCVHNSLFNYSVGLIVYIAYYRSRRVTESSV